MNVVPILPETDSLKTQEENYLILAESSCLLCLHALLLPIKFKSQSLKLAPVDLKGTKGTQALSSDDLMAIMLCSDSFTFITDYLLSTEMNLNI